MSGLAFLKDGRGKNVYKALTKETLRREDCSLGRQPKRSSLSRVFEEARRGESPTQVGRLTLEAEARAHLTRPGARNTRCGQSGVNPDRKSVV